MDEANGDLLAPIDCRSSESVAKKLSFMELLAMVCSEAHNKKTSEPDCECTKATNSDSHGSFTDYVSLADENNENRDTAYQNNRSVGLCGDQVPALVALQHGIEITDYVLPAESGGTSNFNESLFISHAANNCATPFVGNGSRSYSTFNKLDEDSAFSDISSCPKELNGGAIEDSMRRYCEDKKSIMFKPGLGMEFNSAEEAFQFYNMYSWVVGFSIRMGDNYTNKKKVRTMQE